MENWSTINEYILLEIFSYLDCSDLCTVSKICKNWYVVASEDYLWKLKFCHLFGVLNATLPPFAKTWKSEVKRLLYEIPNSENCQELKSPHCEEITHVCFSSDGKYFVTCGRDSFVVLWNAKTGKVIDYEDLTTFGWQAAMYCSFNPECSMLMVSGILHGDFMGRTKGKNYF